MRKVGVTNSYPTVDVIIPAFNAAEYIERTILSVLNQTMLPRQIIVVDDGSNDNTPSIVREIRSELVRLITVTNGGVSRARNIGIRAAEAKYVAFLDADDVWDSHKLEAQVACLESTESAGACYSGASLIDEFDADISGTVAVPYIRGDVFYDILFYERPIYGSASSVIVRRDILIQTDLFDEKMRYSEDVDLWVRLAELTDFEYVEDPHVKIRVHNKSATRLRSWEKDQQVLLQHFYYLNKHCKKNILPLHSIKNYRRRIIRLFFSSPSRLLSLFSFYKRLKIQSPLICTQLGGKNLVGFLVPILFIGMGEFLIRALTRLHPIKRIRLFLREGTFLFSRSRSYNSDAEFLRKKR